MIPLTAYILECFELSRVLPILVAALLVVCDRPGPEVTRSQPKELVQAAWGCLDECEVQGVPRSECAKECSVGPIAWRTP